MVISQRCIALLFLLPLPAVAQVSMTLAAIGQYEYNSNVFDLAPGATYVGLGPQPRRFDTDFKYGGFYDIKDQLSQQTLFADLDYYQYNYDYYTDLDHHEYRLDGGWNGTFASIWNGNFEVVRSYSMIPFLDVFEPTLQISTEQRELGGLGLQFLPSWRIEGSGYTRDTTWPQPGEPNLALHESEGQTALKYVGTAGWTSGLSGTYVSGYYTGSAEPALNPSYRQVSGALVANYMSARSSLLGNIGYTDRSSPGAGAALNDISGLTGVLDYKNQVTGKSSVEVSLQRLINSYITNLGSEIDNVAALTLNWQATYKLDVAVLYSWDYAQFPGQGDNPPGSDRIDHVQNAGFRITYQALRWLVIKPYANYLTRSSNLTDASFDAAVAGINVTVQWQRP